MTKQQLRETVRRIIKQTLNESLTPEEQQELTDIEDELRYNIQTDSAISPSMYKRYKELKAKQQELAEAWEPEVADPDVDTDTKIIPDEDEDDLTFSPDSIPKVNPKAEREMIKKIIARYDSLTEKKYK